MGNRETSIGKILLYGVVVPVLSLFISIPLLIYLDDRLGLFGTGSSDLAVLFVFVIGAFSAGWIASLLRRVIKRSVTRIIFLKYVSGFILVNGVAALSLAVVIALRHRYDISVGVFLLAVAVGLPVGTFVLTQVLTFLTSWGSKWLDNVPAFEKAALSSFEFLSREEGYSEPEVQFARDLYVSYEKPSKEISVAIGWERETYVPDISFWATKPEGRAPVPLYQVLDKLGVVLDTSEFPLCDKLTRGSSLRGILIHLQKKREILLEYPRFLEAYGNALRDNHDAVVEEVRR